jgi:hypothetical protein
MADDHPQREGLSKTLLAVLALVPAIATAITGFLAWRVSSEVESVKAELQQIESQRAFDLEIYKAVKEALAGTAKDQQVALALVVSIGQEPLRAALLGTLEEAPTAAPEIVAQARSYRMPEKAAASQPQGSAAGEPGWADWDFDLFYCEASPAWAKSQADELASAMVADGAKGRIRVRPLSAGKNQESRLSDQRLRPLPHRQRKRHGGQARELRAERPSGRHPVSGEADQPAIALVHQRVSLPRIGRLIDRTIEREQRAVLVRKPSHSGAVRP